MTASPQARPLNADRMSNGSHAKSEMTTIRRRKSWSATPARWARRTIW